MKYSRCPHGWEIKEKDKLPYKKTVYRISVCPECAIQSMCKELSFSIEGISDGDLIRLKELIKSLNY